MLVPEGGKLLRAVKRLVEEREERPDEPLTRAVDRVAMELDLDAAESEWLLRNATRVAREASDGEDG